jgi:hypothetical protein
VWHIYIERQNIDTHQTGGKGGEEERKCGTIMEGVNLFKVHCARTELP